MANLQAFQPQGYTYLGATSYTTGGTASVQGAYVYNASTAQVYLAFGTSSVQAAVATTSLVANGLGMPSSSVQKFTVPPNCWVSAATSLGSGAVYITLGFGT
jgi:hypothetical protein